MNCRTSLSSWRELQAHCEQMKKQHMKSLFECDNNRCDRFSIDTKHFLFDYSKNLISDETVSALLRLASECHVESCRDAMFAGEKINKTESRAVLHTALRNRSAKPQLLEGENLSDLIAQELAHIKAFSEAVRSGDYTGYSNKTITDVVCIGVGGSNLGPQMVTQALKSYSDNRLAVHFVSNVDGVQISQTLRLLNPETTLFIVSSKTFTTTETMINARSAVSWLTRTADSKEDAIAKHFIAVSSNLEAVSHFGILPQNIFSMWDWVGGRYSVWSAIGLPIALFLGFDIFEQFLEGAYEMDTHFRSQPLAHNAPVMMALVGIWNSTFLGAQSQAILPYDQPLHLLPAYLQQADMESNGKSVTRDGNSVAYNTGPIIWGQTGINGQHAFYQLLHQGTTIVPADFIGSVESVEPIEEHHQHLMANFFAQPEALMAGVDEQQVRQDLLAKGLSEAQIEPLVPHKVHPGNRPTNSLLMKKLDAHTLGALIALYEHKIFVQGIIWDVCSFDQWGVELGKVLAKKIEPELAEHAEIGTHDCSTKALMAYYKHYKP
ncbi:MAG: glucose-6-phosphate isomerase [Spongiibacteraceae bacterium]|nr:glucose-6-phosphate isomerase [Spongiibacteraceae bacterium]